MVITRKGERREMRMLVRAREIKRGREKEAAEVEVKVREEERCIARGECRKEVECAGGLLAPPFLSSLRWSGGWWWRRR